MDKDKTSDYEFLQEKIKERPIDKKKLLQRTIVTAALALLFGLVACVTFLLLEPVLNNWIYPEKAPEVVTFPQEEDEMLPEDMLTESELSITLVETEPEETENYAESTESAEGETATTTPSSEIVLPETAEEEEPEDPYYLVTQNQLFYQQLKAKFQEISTSIVTITGLVNDVDFINNEYQSEGQTAGVIVANNNRDLLILTQRGPIKKAEKIQVTFCNKVSVEGTLQAFDEETNLAIIAVDLKYIPASVMEEATVARLGSSVSSSLTGTPVMAIGNIQGYKDNVCYGMITSVGNAVSLQDAQYKLITTDIYGSQKPSGILVNMNGQVIGIIDNSYNNSDIKNMICAVGITELKGMISSLSNNKQLAHAGLFIMDISAQIRATQELPMGVFVSDVRMDSPAMKKGIQKGDIIIGLGEKDIRSATDYTNALREHAPGDEVTVKVLRNSQKAYEEMVFSITLD